MFRSGAKFRRVMEKSGPGPSCDAQATRLPSGHGLVLSFLLSPSTGLAMHALPICLTCDSRQSCQSVCRPPSVTHTRSVVHRLSALTKVGNIVIDSALSPTVANAFTNGIQNALCRHRIKDIAAQLMVGMVRSLPANPSVKSDQGISARPPSAQIASFVIFVPGWGHAYMRFFHPPIVCGRSRCMWPIIGLVPLWSLPRIPPLRDCVSWDAITFSSRVSRTRKSLLSFLHPQIGNDPCGVEQRAVQEVLHR